MPTIITYGPHTSGIENVWLLSTIGIAKLGLITFPFSLTFQIIQYDAERQGRYIRKNFDMPLCLASTPFFHAHYYHMAYYHHRS